MPDLHERRTTNDKNRIKTYPKPIINHHKAIQRQVGEEIEYSYKNTQLTIYRTITMMQETSFNQQYHKPKRLS